MKIKGSVGVARRSDGIIAMHIRDENASVEFCEIRFTPEQFANAVTGLFGQEVELDVRGLEKVGTKHECKNVLVLVPPESPSDWNRFENLPREVWQEAVKEFEVDGWIVESSGWGNHHNRVGTDDGVGYRCTARRWV